MSERKNCPADGHVMIRLDVIAAGVEPGLVAYICPAGDTLKLQRGDGLVIGYSLPNLYDDSVRRHATAWGGNDEQADE